MDSYHAPYIVNQRVLFPAMQVHCGKQAHWICSCLTGPPSKLVLHELIQCTVCKSSWSHIQCVIGMLANQQGVYRCKHCQMTPMPTIPSIQHLLPQIAIPPIPALSPLPPVNPVSIARYAVNNVSVCVYVRGLVQLDSRHVHRNQTFNVQAQYQTEYRMPPPPLPAPFTESLRKSLLSPILRMWVSHETFVSCSGNKLIQICPK